MNNCYWESAEFLHVLTLLMNNSSKPFVSGYSDGRLLVANNAFCQLVGYSQEELNEITWIDLTPQEWREIEAKYLSELSMTGKAQRYEKEYICKDRTRVPIEILVHQLNDAKGNLLFYYAFITDITERKNDKNEFMKLKERFLAVFNVCPLPMAISTLQDGMYIDVNDSFLEHLGYQLDEVVGHNSRELNIFANIDERTKATKILQEEGQLRNFYAYVRTKSGELRPGLFSGNIVKMEDEKYIVTVFNDITELKNTEQILLDSEKRYKTLFENSMDGVLLTKPDGSIIAANPSICKMLGMSEQEICQIGRRGILDESEEKFYDLLFERQQNGRCMGELSLIHKNGSKISVEITSQIFKTSNGQEYTGTFVRDISDRIKNQHEISRLERLNTIGQMAAGIGHEIRNPMTTVRGFLQMLSAKEQYYEHHYVFNLMITELDRANSIISEFLSLSRNNKTDAQSYNLNQIINEIYPLLQSDALNSEKNIIIEQGELPAIKVNRKEIVQLILNLVRNGLEAMQKHSSVTIKTFVDSDEIVLAVIDEGSGVEPSIIEKLGTPFLTTKADGTGLGLVTCYSIAKRHDARIEIDTNMTGTTFFVRFKV